MTLFVNYDLFTTQYYLLEVEKGRNLNRLRRKNIITELES